MFRKIFLSVIASFFVFGMSKLSFAMMCGGHSQHQQRAQAESGEHKHTEHEAAMETTKEAVNVGNKICPLSAEKIDEKTKATYEYEGRIYNFCCEMCIEEFKKDLEKYIKKVEEELKAESKEESEQEEHKIQMMQESEMMHQGMHEGHHR